MSIAFGTEGWRAIMAEEFTVENVCKVAQAVAGHFHNAAGAKRRLAIAVGHDTRFLSDQFARVVCEVLAANGIQALLTDRAIPTCAVSRYVVTNRLAGGLVVTASHNPPPYNGLKIKEAFGGSATPETVASVERRLGRQPVKRLPFDEAARQKQIRVVRMLPAFLAGIRASVDLKVIRRRPLRIVADPMHGTGDRLMERLLTGGRCRIETIHADPDPLFGGQAPEPIPSHLTELATTLKRRRWDVGLATDGDADRIGVVAPTGAFLNAGQVLCILLDHVVVSRGWRGAVVKTVSNTSMIDRLAEALGLKLFEVPVGFKHIAKLMLEDDVLIGGEESGGIGIKGYLPERDGILMGLLLLEAMAQQRQGIVEILGRLERRYGRWTYARRDLTVPRDRIDRLFKRLTINPPARIVQEAVVQVKTLDGVKLIGRDESWLLFRRSGTEPIVRVYAESLQTRQANRLLAFGVQLATTA